MVHVVDDTGALMEECGPKCFHKKSNLHRDYPKNKKIAVFGCNNDD